MDRTDEGANRMDDRSKHSSSPTRHSSSQPTTMAPRSTAHHGTCIPQDPTDARIANANWMAEPDGRAPILLDSTDPTETHPPESTPVVRQKMDPTIPHQSLLPSSLNVGTPDQYQAPLQAAPASAHATATPQQYHCRIAGRCPGIIHC